MNPQQGNTNGQLPSRVRTPDPGAEYRPGPYLPPPPPPYAPASSPTPANRPRLVPAQSQDEAPGSEMPLWPVYTGVAVGVALALAIIPAWVPVLGGSLASAQPKAFWYLSRASGLTSFVLLWVSMASGLIITNRIARVWPGPFAAFDLHQFTSLLGLGFAAFHVVVLLGEHFIGLSLFQLLVPFAATPYRPFWVGLGQLAIYLMIPVTFTFYFRKQLGMSAWRIIHLVSYGVFALALFHGLGSGTDSTQPWAQWVYALGGVSILLLSAYRLIVEQNNTSAQERRA